MSTSLLLNTVGVQNVKAETNKGSVLVTVDVLPTIEASISSTYINFGELSPLTEEYSFNLEGGEIL